MKYFTMRELTHSTTAVNRGIDNTPSLQHAKNLKALVENLLDPIREKYGKPIIISSGYRCSMLNTIVGGAAMSQHLFGYAVDIRSLTDTLEDNKKLLDLIKSMDPPYDQLIWEYGTSKGPDWIHISYSPKNRHQYLEIGKK